MTGIPLCQINSRNSSLDEDLTRLRRTPAGRSPLTPNLSPALGAGEPKSIELCKSPKRVVTILCNNIGMTHCPREGKPGRSESEAWNCS